MNKIELIQNFLKQIDLQKVDFGFEIHFPNGEKFVFDQFPIKLKIYFKNEQAIDEFLAKGNLGFAEQYMEQNIDIEGDLYYLTYLGHVIELQGFEPNFIEKLKILYHRLTHRNTLVGSRKNIRHHYDVGNDFYSLWLDKNLQYTCAFFRSPKDSLEKAQLQKMDLVCRKLQFRKGDFVVEAGSGWGGFAIYAVKKYGVRMRSYNISEKQVEYAREWQKREGISEKQLEFVLDDYRSIRNDGYKYDKFVSIGMLEHVGPENYESFFDLIYQKIPSKGLALVHTISRVRPREPDPWINKYIFPGGYIPSLGEIITSLERAVNKPKKQYLFVMDIENLKYHYALTLDHWAKRFEENVETIRQKYGESFVRMYRMYLRGSASGFRRGELTLVQILLKKDQNPDYPLTREHFILPTTEKRKVQKVK
ncbi:MAG: cyclopropane-fatty-acyl-phospholipid synthase family protein [Leptospiraceae bacterium]|nr:cyclopropane-fatty-acyl-phospholipid synthase family protein [Leptospiraceae bacterium]MDW7975743.1 cyclopropane-fatty-acyl-phospholipid synthase family protein [Leptospiraceae bacterium]